MGRKQPDTGLYLDGLDHLHRGIVYSAQAQAVTGATLAVAWAGILATDIVLTQMTTYATIAYIAKVVITAGTGFVATLSTAPGTATFDYAILRTASLI